MIAQCYTREGVQPDQLTLHADRGAPMTSKTIAELLIDLGVAQSHSRPTYPERVVDIDGSRVWMRGFAGWYTTQRPLDAGDTIGKADPEMLAVEVRLAPH